MNPKWEEKVLVINNGLLFENCRRFQGFNSNIHDVAFLTSAISNGFDIMRRGNENDPTPKDNNAEINKDYKQIIPYGILKVGNKIFAYERLNQSGEERLHSKLSIGLGGHMNQINSVLWDEILEENLLRELNEEIEIEGNYGPEIEYVGYINDDYDSVGEVHLGLLVIIEYPEGTKVNVKETNQLKGELVEPIKLIEECTYNKLENWSKIAIKELMFG